MPDPVVHRTRDELIDARNELTGRVAAVMTLGALHEAHRALMREARRLVGADGSVVVTIFVNPLQFGRGEDFEKYPRPVAADVAVCAEEGVDAVFAPAHDEIYPTGIPAVTVDPGPLAGELEGAARPTHFAGVLTVVAKLLNLIRPDFTTFGEKDYQQLCLVRQMVRDLDMPYEVVAIPTVREPDGLALSSRNVYLSTEQREAALLLPRALEAGRAAAPGGPREVMKAAAAVLHEGGASVPSMSVQIGDNDETETAVMWRRPGLRTDADRAVVEVAYLTLRGPDLSPVVRSGPARLLVAAKVGSTRLLDNVAVTLP